MTERLSEAIGKPFFEIKPKIKNEIRSVFVEEAIGDQTGNNVVAKGRFIHREMVAA